MKGNGSSERHQNDNLNMIIEFSNFFDSNTTFYDINRKEQILSFLDTKIKDSEKDPEKKWITSLAVNPILFINASSSSPCTLSPSTTNQTFSHDSSSSVINIMIGELISEGQGKIIGQRNIDSEESQNSATAKIEVSHSGPANIKGIGNVSETCTYVNTHRPNAIIQGKGYGTIITEDGNGVSTATEYGRGNTYINLIAQMNL